MPKREFHPKLKFIVAFFYEEDCMAREEVESTDTVGALVLAIMKDPGKYNEWAERKDCSVKIFVKQE